MGSCKRFNSTEGFTRGISHARRREVPISRRAPGRRPPATRSKLSAGGPFLHPRIVIGPRSKSRERLARPALDRPTVAALLSSRSRQRITSSAAQRGEHREGMMIAIDHIAVSARDVVASARFLAELLGVASAAPRGPEGEMRWLAIGE